MRAPLSTFLAAAAVAAPATLLAQNRAPRAPVDPAVRPRTIVGEFRGYYERGFEHTRFLPCRRRSGVPAGHPLRTFADSHSVWVEIADTAGGPPRGQWPTAPQTVVRGRLVDRSYVRWRGTLEGPGRYGHFAEGTYQLRVDRVLQVAPAGPPGC